MSEDNSQLVLVTGAGSGIGRAIAIRFARMGAHVVATDIDIESARATAAIIRGGGHRCTPGLLDVTDPQEWERTALDLHAEHGVPDVLVNNAGMLVSGPFLELAPEHWNRQLSVNLLGVVYGCRAIGARMAERGSGHIVNIASAAAFVPTPVMSPYSVSKAGVKMLTECLRLELGPKGIGVSAVCPGFINTDIGKHAVTVGVDQEVVDRGQRLAERAQEFMEQLPWSPMNPDQVARAAVRAVRYDLPVVPVRPEAWLGYLTQRFAPSVNRRIAAPFTADRYTALAERLFGVRQ